MLLLLLWEGEGGGGRVFNSPRERFARSPYHSLGSQLGHNAAQERHLMEMFNIDNCSRLAGQISHLYVMMNLKPPHVTYCGNGQPERSPSRSYEWRGALL
jgi:hypothetical protein